MTREENLLAQNPVFVNGLGWCKLVATCPWAVTVADDVMLRIVQIKPPLQENGR